MIKNIAEHLKNFEFTAVKMQEILRKRLLKKIIVLILFNVAYLLIFVGLSIWLFKFLHLGYLAFVPPLAFLAFVF